ncbi:MAG TPA: hypothetical protein VNO30_14765 [Kofleriaceae bacterium]|nr:hypothetical protein [Kofleriaceae bacterium]
MNQERVIIEPIASNFFCSHMLAHDFADQCEVRLDDLDFDLRCGSLALELWATSPKHVRPVLDALHELTEERERHRDVLVRLRERLLDLSDREAVHHHLDYSPEDLRQQVRRALSPDPSSPDPDGPKNAGSRGVE